MFVLNQFNKFKCTPEALVVQDSALVYFLKTIIGGVGKNSTIKAEFSTTIRVMPDLNVLANNPAA